MAVSLVAIMQADHYEAQQYSYGWHKFYSYLFPKRKEMANIDVQKKKSNPWPLIIILILALAVAGYFIWRNGQQQNAGTTTTTDSTITRNDTTTTP